MLEEPRVLTVSELTENIKILLEDHFPFVSVRGEISNLDRSQRGHFYFTLKDSKAQLKAVLYKGRARFYRDFLKNGNEVICTGPITVYRERGEYQIVVEYMEKVGLGALYAEFVRLKDLLEKEGLFDDKYKLPLPFLPRKVGIITSPEGAAIRDILRIIGQHKLHIVIYPSHVQGKDAAKEIVSGIEFFNREQEVELIILARGGGSIEDLWAFNEEVVARAIHASRIPIISAVGHERDWTISDYVADHRCATPTHAATFLVEREKDFRKRLADAHIHLTRYIQNLLSHRKKDLALLKKRLEAKDPKRTIFEKMRKLDESATRIHLATVNLIHRKRKHLEMLAKLLDARNPAKRVEESKKRLLLLKEKLSKLGTSLIERRRSQVASLKAKLEILSPRSVLSRGYAICYYQGKVLKRAKDVPKKALIMIELSEGALECRVKEKRDLFRSF